MGSADADMRSATAVVRAFVSSGIGPASTDRRMEQAERAYLTPKLYAIAKKTGANPMTFTQDTGDAAIYNITESGAVVRVTFLVIGSGAKYTHEYRVIPSGDGWKIDDIIYHFPRAAAFSIRNAPADEHGTCVQRPNSVIQDCN